MGVLAAAETVAPTNPRFALQFVDGFQHALETGAVIALVGSLLSAILIRSKPAALGAAHAPDSKPSLRRPMHQTPTRRDLSSTPRRPRPHPASTRK